MADLKSYLHIILFSTNSGYTPIIAGRISIWVGIVCFLLKLLLQINSVLELVWGQSPTPVSLHKLQILYDIIEIVIVS